MSEARADGRLPTALAALALLAIHLCLVAYFFGDNLIPPTIPFNRGDFSTHATQAKRVIAGLDGWGKPWVWDPYLLAGAPNGVLFDADVKAWELWTWALTHLGVAWGRAYNAFVLAGHLSVPFVVYASARLLRCDRRDALGAAGLGVALWFFDSFTHWMWFIGTISYSLVAFYALLPLALFYRWIEDRRAIFALGCAAAMAVGHLIHPYIFFVLVAPMLALYLRAALVERSMSLKAHAITWAIALVTLAANAWWLLVALRFVHYLLDSAFYAQGGLRYLIYDPLGLVDDPGSQGLIGPRTAVRTATLIAALLGLRAWRIAGDRRRLPFLVLLATMAALTYLGRYTPFAQIQPYRHNLPLGFAALIPAASWLRDTLNRRPWRGLNIQQRGLALILAGLAALHLGRDVLYFFAGDMRGSRTLEDGREVIMNTLGHAFIPPYSYDDQDDWEQILALITKLDAQNQGRGRWLIHNQVFGEYVMARTDAQVLGGFVVRNIEHSDANWFRRAGGKPPYDLDAFRRYLETYAVRWVVIRKDEHSPWWDQQPQLLTRAGFADGILIYRVNLDAALLDGRGQLEVGVNQVAVRGSDPQADLLLRFHWLETLRCTPDCRIERVPVEGDRVGFMRVPAPHPADFRIENGYRFD
ncbi:hypothetical protein G6O69_31445 [Pseudenhygromyxa sp. WMMC2535]|uniref:hypothetical protein n=1 Tax=Pseudenhygromyxa sp. WMMC2535 TaxID=2712867 RepID=UPI001554FE92|nr:hypothetical protein [Pseudenhygromyxa sp. WMMC2535]NVB42380.1 hypothetical protein [Pseudenhygromyxa sp. WMMC2535]